MAFFNQLSGLLSWRAAQQKAAMGSNAVSTDITLDTTSTHLTPVPSTQSCKQGVSDVVVKTEHDAKLEQEEAMAELESDDAGSEQEDDALSGSDSEEYSPNQGGDSGFPTTRAGSGANKLSRFRGVTFDKGKQQWRTQIKVHHLGKSGVSVGYFQEEEDAARAYDRASIGLFGKSDVNPAHLNFPLTAYADESIPSMKGLSREQIKELLRHDRVKSPRRHANNKPRTSKYLGVGATNRTNQWQARILVDTKVTHLGYYGTQEEAAKVYDKVALALHGDGAQLNYPDYKYDRAEIAKLAAKGKLSREDLQKQLGVKPMDKSSKYRGVSRKKNKWEAKVMVNRQWKYRELFPTEVEAARAYDLAVRQLKGPEAESYVNFKEGESDPLEGMTRIVRSSKKLRSIGVEFPPEPGTAGGALQGPHTAPMRPQSDAAARANGHHNGNATGMDVDSMHASNTGLRISATEPLGPPGGPCYRAGYDLGPMYGQAAVPNTPQRPRQQQSRLFTPPGPAVAGGQLFFSSKAPPGNPFATHSGGLADQHYDRQTDGHMPYSGEEHVSEGYHGPSPYAADVARGAAGPHAGPRDIPAGYQVAAGYHAEGGAQRGEGLDLQGSNQLSRLSVAASEPLFQGPHGASRAHQMAMANENRVPSRISSEQWQASFHSAPPSFHYQRSGSIQVPQHVQHRSMSHGPAPQLKRHSSMHMHAPYGPSMRPGSYHGYASRHVDDVYPGHRGLHDGDEGFPARPPSHEHMEHWYSEGPAGGPYRAPQERGFLPDASQGMRGVYRSRTMPDRPQGWATHSLPPLGRQGSYQGSGGPLTGAFGPSFSGSNSGSDRAQQFAEYAEMQRLRHLHLRDSSPCPSFHDREHSQYAHEGNQQYLHQPQQYQQQHATDHMPVNAAEAGNHMEDHIDGPLGPLGPLQGHADGPRDLHTRMDSASVMHGMHIKGEQPARDDMPSVFELYTKQGGESQQQGAQAEARLDGRTDSVFCMHGMGQTGKEMQGNFEKHIGKGLPIMETIEDVLAYDGFDPFVDFTPFDGPLDGSHVPPELMQSGSESILTLDGATPVNAPMILPETLSEGPPGAPFKGREASRSLSIASNMNGLTVKTGAVSEGQHMTSDVLATLP